MKQEQTVVSIAGNWSFRYESTADKERNTYEQAWNISMALATQHIRTQTAHTMVNTV